MRYPCFLCGKSVTSELPDDSVIRACLVCPECIEARRVTFPDEVAAAYRTIYGRDIRKAGTPLEPPNDGAAEAARDYAGKLHFLISWIDSKGLLPEHVFTFPDGDTWQAKPPNG